MISIELLYFVIMIAIFIVLLLLAKLPSGIALMVSAIVGFICYIPLGVEAGDLTLASFFNGEVFRYFVEGTFAYFDTILVITAAMIFMGVMQSSGALEYLSALLVKTFRKFPSILLICFIIIIMFPAMVTGSSLASAISAGALLAPIMIKWGIPKSKAAAIVAVGSVLGMVAPPINVPAMVICDVVDIPYVNFTLPLLLLSIPVAIISVILLGRKYVKPISEEELGNIVNLNILSELNWTVCLPIIVLVLMIIGEIIFPKILGSYGMVAMFVTATIINFFVGRKLPFWSNKGRNIPYTHLDESEKIEENLEGKEDEPNCVVDVIRQGVHKSFSAMGLLMGVGMFMEIITLNGVRGFFATNAVVLGAVNTTVGYVSMGVTLPIFGGISAFGSASVLGGPFVMMLNGICDNVIVTCGLSLLAAIGEFLPPTAMSATITANMVGEDKWTTVSKSAIPAIIVMFVYALAYTIGFGLMIQKLDNDSMVELITFAILIVLSVAFVVVYEILLKNKKNKVGGQA